MKVVFTIFLVYNVICHLFYYLLDAKQNLSHAWLLRSHALGKLTLYDIFLSIKWNLSYAWLPGLHALGELILNDIFLSVK